MKGTGILANCQSVSKVTGNRNVGRSVQFLNSYQLICKVDLIADLSFRSTQLLLIINPDT